jgi:hypothetical protein
VVYSGGRRGVSKIVLSFATSNRWVGQGREGSGMEFDRGSFFEVDTLRWYCVYRSGASFFVRRVCFPGQVMSGWIGPF